MKRIILTVFLLVLCAAGYAALRLYLYWTTPVRPARPVEVIVDIPEGSGLKKIARILEDRGAIRDRMLFTGIARLKETQHRIQSGEYCLQLPLAPREILDRLVRGDIRLLSVTIPEGSTIFDIARIIERSGLAPAEVIVQKATDPAIVKAFGYDNESLEGFLFPDTYKFSKKTEPQKMLARMTARFDEVLSRELNDPKPGTALPLRDMIILASLVEKETPQPSEKPVIAGVFFNRLKRGMRLECDPTVVYGVMLEDPQFQGRLRKKHLLKTTRYNTYQISGLPYGPICNPGLDSIRAVLQPAAVDYLFFVSRNNGTHQFSRTLEEHTAAVNQYQRKH